MNPGLVYGLAALGIGGGGYYVYRKRQAAQAAQAQQSPMDAYTNAAMGMPAPMAGGAIASTAYAVPMATGASAGNYGAQTAQDAFANVQAHAAALFAGDRSQGAFFAGSGGSGIFTSGSGIGATPTTSGGIPITGSIDPGGNVYDQWGNPATNPGDSSGDLLGGSGFGFDLTGAIGAYMDGQAQQTALTMGAATDIVHTQMQPELVRQTALAAKKLGHNNSLSYTYDANGNITNISTQHINTTMQNIKAQNATIKQGGLIAAINKKVSQLTGTTFKQQLKLNNYAQKMGVDLPYPEVGASPPKLTPAQKKAAAAAAKAANAPSNKKKVASTLPAPVNKYAGLSM